MRFLMTVCTANLLIYEYSHHRQEIQKILSSLDHVAE